MHNLATFLMFAGASLFCLSLYGIQRRTPPLLATTRQLMALVHSIKLAASASRGIPDGDTVALQEIVDLIKHFEDTH